jgi:hypothetical protein
VDRFTLIVFRSFQPRRNVANLYFSSNCLQLFAFAFNRSHQGEDEMVDIQQRVDTIRYLSHKGIKMQEFKHAIYGQAGKVSIAQFHYFFANEMIEEIFNLLSEIATLKAVSGPSVGTQPNLPSPIPDGKAP